MHAIWLRIYFKVVSLVVEQLYYCNTDSDNLNLIQNMIEIKNLTNIGGDENEYILRLF